MKQEIELDEIISLTIAIVQLLTAITTLQVAKQNKKNSSKKTSSKSKKKK